MPLRRVLLALFSLLLVAGAAFALMGGEARRELLGQEVSCPPGYLGEEQLELRERREQRAARRRAEEGEAERERERRAARRLPRRQGPGADRRADADPDRVGPPRPRRPGRREDRRLRARRRRTRSGSRPRPARSPARPASGRRRASGPLIGDDPRYDEVNGQGLADQNGRPSDFAFDPQGRRLYAAVGEGGVWVADETGGFDDWRSIGDTLPTQAVGGIAYSPADGGTADRPHRRQRLRRRRHVRRPRRLPHDRRRRDLAARERRAGRRHRLQGRGRPDQPAGRLRGHGRGPVPLDRRRRDVRQRQPADRQGVAERPAELHRRRPRQGGLRAREHGHRRRRPGPGATRRPPARQAGRGASPPSAGAPATSKRDAGTRRLRRVAQQRHLPLRRPARPARSRRSTRRHRPPSARRTARRAGAIGRIELGDRRRARRRTTSYLYAIVQDAGASSTAASPRSTSRGRDRPGPGQRPYLNGIYVSPDFGQTLDADGRRASSIERPTRLGLRADRHGCADVATARASRPGTTSGSRRTRRGRRRRRPDAARRSASRRSGQNRALAGRPRRHGPTQFEVVGRYFAGDARCLFLNTGAADCPTTARRPGAEHDDAPRPARRLWMPDGRRRR